MRLVAPGITIDLPDGWEAEVDSGAGNDSGAGSTAGPGGDSSSEGDPHPGGERPVLRTPRTHIANFPLPPDRGDYGSGAVDVMRRGDVLVCLLEEDAGAADSVLHGRTSGITPLAPADFDPDAMQRPRGGQSGAQSFFRVGERAFVLYVVLAERMNRGAQVDEVNEVLAGIRFD